MMRKVLLSAAVVALGAAGSAALAEPMALSDAQMDGITAGMDTVADGMNSGTVAAATDAGMPPATGTPDQAQGQATLPAEVVSAIILGAGAAVNTVTTEVFAPLFTPGALAPGSIEQGLIPASRRTDPPPPPGPSRDRGCHRWMHKGTPGGLPPPCVGTSARRY